MWGDQVSGYCKSLKPVLAPRAVLRVSYYVSEPHANMMIVTDELLNALVTSGVIVHPACVVEIQARQLPQALAPERIVVSIEPHWSSTPAGIGTKWDKE